MSTINGRVMLFILATGIIILAACSGAGTINNQQPSSNGTSTQQSQNNAPAQLITTTVSTPAATPQTATAAQKTSKAETRVDVIYFHAAQRCVTCMCFEQHVTSVVDKYFQDPISNGKMTYRVLNAATPENKEVAKQYGAVGSQLFINVIIQGVDNIADIQDIWSWKCTGNPVSFERKVKTIIDQALLKVP